MKATLDQTEDSLSTTPETKTKFKEELFNHIDKLVADHDVTVSNTMIKITYKKVLKDQSASDLSGDSESEKIKTEDVAKSPPPEESKSPNEAEKKRKYVNGLNLVPKSSLPEILSGGNGGSSAAEVKTNKLDSGKKFLNEGTSDKLENSVIVLEVDKSKTLEGMKRKSSVELGMAKSKKLKISGSRAQKGPKRFKRRIMLVDPDLPAGWTRFIRIKNKGTDKEQYVVYVVDPQGKRFRYRWKLRQYLEKTNSSLDADQFFFGVYEKPKTSPGKEENLWKKEKTPEPKPTVTPDLKPFKPSSPEKKKPLLYDPDLPFGWKRIITSNSENGRKQVHIISPDGTIFRRRYRLQEYLEKHQFTHNLNRFYFGLYPKKEENTGDGSEKKSLSLVKDSPSTFVSAPMLDDPNLPDGWFRLIKLRSCGERMEVIIVSPDGRRHRTKKHLEQYLSQNGLNYRSEDFDFTLFGKSKANRGFSEREDEPALEPENNVGTGLEREEEESRLRRRFSERPVPNLDIKALKETVITPEGHLINAVNGLMMCSGLSSARNERRQRVPRKEFEKELRNFLTSQGRTDGDALSEGCEIPTRWIERLVKLRSEFRNLEPNAIMTIAETTKNFLQQIAVHALVDSERELRYDDIADIVDRTKCLSFLKTLIPKKITFKEFIRLNRPKQFSSFT